MGRRNSKSRLFKRQNATLKKKFGRFLRAGFCITLVSALISVEATNSYFSDIENSSLEMTAGTLQIGASSGQNNFSPNDRAIDLKPGEYVARDVYVKKEGSLPMRYGAKVSKDSSCDQALFDQLELRVYYNFYHTQSPEYPSYHQYRTMRQLYSGKLSGFEINDVVPNLDELQIPNEHEHFDNRFYDEDDHWLYFRVELPSDTDSSLEEKNCAFDFDFEAWQENNTDGSVGFHDSASLSSMISTTDWTAPEQISQMTIFRGHNSEDENEIGCRGYTNDTRIRIDWEDSLADDIDYYWFGTRRNEKHKKIDASKSHYDGNMTPGKAPYYYTVIAVDKSGNESQISNPCGNLVLDQAAPEVSFDNLSTGATLSGEYEIRGTLTDDSPSKYIVSVISAAGIAADDSGEKTAFVSFLDHPIFDWDTTNVENGNYIVTFSAIDFAGNSASTSATVEVANSATDTTPPTVDFVSPSNGAVISGTLSIVGDVADDNPKEYWVEIRDKTTGVKVFAPAKITNYSSVLSHTLALFDTTTVPDGAYEIEIFAEDQSGNDNSDEITVMFLNNTSGAPVQPPSTGNGAKENVVINEFLPNPADGDEEFVELYNKSTSETFDLADWYIGDESTLNLIVSNSSTTSGSTEIGPEDYLVLEISSSKLNNDGDTVTLFNEIGDEIDSKSYDDSTEDKSYQRIPDGESDWEEATPTKDDENEADSSPAGRTSAPAPATRTLVAPVPTVVPEEEKKDPEETKKPEEKQEEDEKEESTQPPAESSDDKKTPPTKEPAENKPIVDKQPAKSEEEEPQPEEEAPKDENKKDDAKLEQKEEPATKPEEEEESADDKGDDQKAKEEDEEAETKEATDESKE